MTKYILNRPNGPWEYAALGFTAVDGAILDGSLFTPPLASPPDAYWSVYGGGSAETGVVRRGVSEGVISPSEPSDGFVLAYSGEANTYLPADPADIFAGGGITRADVATDIADPDSAIGEALADTFAPDTGLRQVDTDTMTLVVQRVASCLELTLNGNGTETTDIPAGTIPLGWRPRIDIELNYYDADAGIMNQALVGADGSIGLLSGSVFGVPKGFHVFTLAAGDFPTEPYAGTPFP